MKKGFTLIELLAVIVIIAIIGTIGAYSITKIINKTRMDSLKNTAFAVRKAARLYVAEHPDMIFPKNLYMTPGADDAHLLNLGKDPWGKDYIDIIAKIRKENNKQIVDVYIFLENGDYFLANNAKNISPLIFQAYNLNAPLTVQSGENLIVNYEVLAEYKDSISEVVPIIKSNGVVISSDNYQIVSSNNSSITLKLNNSGSYSCQLILKRNVGKDSDISQPVNFNVSSAPIFLPATMYFRSDIITVNGLSAYKLGTTSSSIGNGFGYYDDDRAYGSGLNAFIKVIRRTSNGTEEIINDYRQAPVYIASGYAVPFLKTATYNFPGWSSGNESDSLVVEVGLSHLSTGAPIFTRRFTTDSLNATSLKPQTWTVYYYLDNDFEEFSYATFMHGSSTRLSRIVTTQT